MLETNFTKKYLVFVFIGLSTCLFFLDMIFIFFLSRNASPETPQSHYSYDYQFTEVNPFFEEAGVTYPPPTGFITLPQSLEFEEDYISYLNEETESSIIITNFGGSKYSCTGSCYCNEQDDDSFRRIMTRNILSKSLVVLFSAFSTTMAYKIAHDTFLEQCQQKHSLVCRSENIKSEVDECSEESQKEEEKRNHGSLGHRYFCKGHCVDEPNNDPSVAEIGLRMFGLCENLKIEKEIELIQDKKDVSQEVLRLNAIYKFVTEILTQFCGKNSLIPFSSLPNVDQQMIKDMMGMLEQMYQSGQGGDEIAEQLRDSKTCVEEGVRVCSGTLLEQTQGGVTMPQALSSVKHVQCVEV